MANEIAEGIFYEDAYMGVTVGALVHSMGVVMIDAPLRVEDGRLWRSILFSQRSGPNRILILLDAHPDRTLGVSVFDSTVIAHKRTAQAYHGRPTIFKGQGAPMGAIYETYPEAIGMRWVPPQISFTDNFTIHWGTNEAVLEHRPGPMPGAIWVVVPGKKVLFVGDAVSIGQPPFFAQANVVEWLENLDALQNDYRDYTIVCSRGGIVKPEHIRLQKAVLTSVKDGMEKLAKKDAQPQATESLAKALLRKYNFSSRMKDLYEIRLRSGLMLYYARYTRHLASGDEGEVKKRKRRKRK